MSDLPIPASAVRVWSDVSTPPRRERLWLKEGKKCHWCGVETRLHPTKPDGSYHPQAWDMATIDHVVPRCAGGIDNDSNLVSACALCNNRRGHEFQVGLPDGAMLNKYDPDKGMVYRGKKKVIRQPMYVALTGDEKKAILNGQLPSTVKHTAEQVLREQRDQAQKEIAHLRNELKLFQKIVGDQEAEIKKMKAEASVLSISRMLRMRLSEWLRPK